MSIHINYRQERREAKKIEEGRIEKEKLKKGIKVMCKVGWVLVV